MTIWLIRPPKAGGYDDRALASGLVTGEFGVRGDHSQYLTLEEMTEAVEAATPQERKDRIDSHARQLVALLFEVAHNDFVIHPHDGRRSIAIGVVTAGATEDDEGRPARKVEWLRNFVSLHDLGGDIRLGFSAGAQVSRIDRPGLPNRLRAIIAAGRDPAPGLVAGPQGYGVPLTPEALTLRFQEQIQARFASHDLALLVAELLSLEGYRLHVSPPGPDGGIDLIGGRGVLGLEGPTIVVQVKSGSTVVGDPVVQSLRGAMQEKGADRGLLVSWSGVTGPARQHIERERLRVALWTAEDIVKQVIGNADRLPDWVTARIPFRMVPVLLEQP